MWYAWPGAFLQYSTARAPLRLLHIIGGMEHNVMFNRTLHTMLPTALREDCIRTACIADPPRPRLTLAPFRFWVSETALAATHLKEFGLPSRGFTDPPRRALSRTPFAPVVLPRPTRYRQQSWRAPDLMGAPRVRPPVGTYPKTCSTTRMTMPT